MKLQFKEQAFQLEAVDSVADLFEGQRELNEIIKIESELFGSYHLNAPIKLGRETLLKRVQKTQIKHKLTPSEALSLERFDDRDSYNFSIEMETGTGKTYTYIRTIMELNKRYGWLKFIIVVPSIAIREGVAKSFETMSEHFRLHYGKSPKSFIYDSSNIVAIKDFATSPDIEVMIINSQAFNARGKDARRIHMAQESMAYQVPMDVIAMTRPIVIIDEPQSVEGKQTKKNLKDFKPLFTLRYSATHKDKHDMLYRLDAMDAYNQQLVKKIAVKSIAQTNLMGTSGYLYLQALIPQAQGAPKARIEFEQKTKSGIKRTTKLVSAPFDLYQASGELTSYQGMVLQDFDARPWSNSIQVGLTKRLGVGEVMGDIAELDLRRLQIRETIKTHLQKEAMLYQRGIKVLSLFFIDQVAHYKAYDDNHQALNGDYATIFEEEYDKQVSRYLREHKQEPNGYYRYLERYQEARLVHAGYFSIDKVKKSDKTIFVDYKKKSEKGKDSSDKDAYDLIMRDKERLLSFDEPVRFIFSHSALKEGWDNPNVFQICTLKTSHAETRKRQEIGRGMRLCVNQNGNRQDASLLGESKVHDINKLTVIANESYDSFARSLQAELREVLKDKAYKLDSKFLPGKTLTNANGEQLIMDEELAEQVLTQLKMQGYLDKEGFLTETYYSEKEAGQLFFDSSLAGFEEAMADLMEKVSQHMPVENANQADFAFKDEVNDAKLEAFKDLWQTINKKSVYRVHLDEDKLIGDAVKAINNHLHIQPLIYSVQETEVTKLEKEGLKSELTSQSEERMTLPHITERYDLLARLSQETDLTRQTLARILTQISPSKFEKFKDNPEDFIRQTASLINEQKAISIVQNIEYKLTGNSYDSERFYQTTERAKFPEYDKNVLKAECSIYNYIKVDSNTEKDFQRDLETSSDVKVYAKLPSWFHINTPFGNYNPDWAIAFHKGSVKHIYFIAETKGSSKETDLRAKEKNKIDCARAHFKKLQAAGYLEATCHYDVVSSFSELMAKASD